MFAFASVATNAIEGLATTTTAVAAVDRLAMIAGIATATNAKVLANFAATINLTPAAVGVA